jgi:hypothetical protein
MCIVKVIAISYHGLSNLSVVDITKAMGNEKKVSMSNRNRNTEGWDRNCARSALPSDRRLDAATEMCAHGHHELKGDRSRHHGRDAGFLSVVLLSW